MIRWPWVSRKAYEKMLTERSILLDVIRNANAELRSHKALLAGLSTGHKEMTQTVEKMFLVKDK